MRRTFTNSMTATWVLVILLCCGCKKNRCEDSNSNILSGTRWLVTRFDNTWTNNSEFPSDTIHFVSTNRYRINQFSEQDYHLKDYCENENSFGFKMYNCNTFGGTVWVNVNRSFIRDGELQNVYMQGQADNDIIVWMEKLN